MGKFGFYTKWIFILLCLIYLLIVIMLNMEPCNVDLLFKKMNVPIFILIAFSILIGIAIGIVFTFISFRKIRKKDKLERKAQETEPKETPPAKS